MLTYFPQITVTLLGNSSATARTPIISVVLFICVPFFVEGVLIIRVCAAYPPKTLSSIRILAIYGPIALLKMGRAANIGLLIFHLARAIDDSGGLSSNTVFIVTQVVWTLPSTKGEWLLQLFDDMYD